MRGSEKIRPVHRDRLAVVYLRQSSMIQVLEHGESTMRQYALAQTAAELGWAPGNVRTIDTDLGVSGKWGTTREGFVELIGLVCAGSVGAIVGIEISRLARSNAEIARLLEFAKITDTLLIDADGVYDPADVNDRMLLGLKGTMGEVELHVMAQRLQASKRAAAERGELRAPLPVGYVYDIEGHPVIDPDAEVQAAIADLFCAFAQTGSAYGVVGAFSGRRFPLRAYGGTWAGQLRWGRLTHSRVLGVLRNPVYAGAYVHGRYTAERTIDQTGTVRTKTVRRPRPEWPVLIKDHHEAYLSWTDYLDNEARIAANRTNTGARPAREGAALCQGIIHCGSCGAQMATNHRGGQASSYECVSRSKNRATATCRSITAAGVDCAVTARLLAALTPEHLALALAAAETATDRHRSASRAASLAVERARYTAGLAERAFCAVDPDNRLVAATLESRWERALTALAEAEAAAASAADTVGPKPDRSDLETLAGDVDTLWHAESTTDKDRKRMLRTLISDITILPEPDRRTVAVGIRWHTGKAETITIPRPTHPGTARRTDPAALDLVRELGPTTNSTDLATLLNGRGLRTGTGKPFDTTAVQWIRHAHGITAPSPLRENEITVADAAARLGSTTSLIYDWVKAGKLDARRGSGNRLCLPWNDRIETEARARIAASGHLNPAARKTRPRRQA